MSKRLVRSCERASLVRVNFHFFWSPPQDHGRRIAKTGCMP